MSDYLDENGLHIDDETTRLSNMVTDFQTIYGTDINLDSNSPDMQLLSIFVTAIQDNFNLLKDVYNSFDPDLANGINLGARCAINNVQKQGSSFTKVPIDITVDRALNLTGLDNDAESTTGTGYTIKDSSGNNFILLSSQTFTTAETRTVNFRAENIGAVLTTLNTITIPVTIIAGVVSVNNSQSAIETGVDEELDSQLRARRQISTMVNAQGYLYSLQAQLLNLDRVTDAIVFDNPTSDTVDGIPPFGIWCIVLGGVKSDIANTIYKGRWGGGMQGSETYDITQVNGTIMTIKYDIPIGENLYIKIICTDITGSVLDTNYIKTQINLNISYKINQTVNSTDIVYYLKGLLDDLNISYCEVSSDNTNYYQTLSPTTKQHKFVLDTERIIVNGQ